VLQIIWSANPFTEGVGKAVIENVWVAPEQVFENGVTTIKVVCGTFVTLVTVKALILPVPDKGTSPTVAFEFVHWYIVLAMAEPVKITGAVDKLLHNGWLRIKFTLGAAFTVIEKEVVVPEQELENGVTEIMPVIGALVAFAAVNEFIFPTPETPSPIPAFVFAH
jgi:hypothetical protein